MPSMTIPHCGNPAILIFCFRHLAYLSFDRLSLQSLQHLLTLAIQNFYRADPIHNLNDADIARLLAWNGTDGAYNVHWPDFGLFAVCNLQL